MQEPRFFKWFNIMTLATLMIFVAPCTLAADSTAALPVLTPQTGVDYSVVYKHSQKCQDVRYADSTPGSEVIQWPCHSRDNQKLRLVDKGNGYYSLVYRHSNQCTDVYTGGTAAGEKVIQWPCHGGDNQLFTLEYKGNAYYSFRFKHSGQCLDVFAASSGDGENVIQWPCHGGDNQLFAFDSVLLLTRNASEGAYSGTVDSALPIILMVLNDGQYWGLFGLPSTQGLIPAGFVQGNATATNGNFASTNLHAFLADGQWDGLTDSVNGSYVSGVSISGTVTEPPGGETLSLSVSAIASTTLDYNAPANLSAISGYWAGYLLDGSPTAMNITSSGSLEGATTSGCAFSGTITPRSSGKNVFNLAATLAGSGCPYAGVSVNGIAYSLAEPSGRRTLVAHGVNASRNLGWAFFGTR